MRVCDRCMAVDEPRVCDDCDGCVHYCTCRPLTTFDGFDADELGLDPETDNFPEDPSRA